MSTLQNFLLTLSFLGWFGIIIYEFLRKKKKYLKSFSFQSLIIISFLWVFHRYFGYFNTVILKGAKYVISEGWLMLGLYLFTILGIIGHHIFTQIKEVDLPCKQSKLKWMPIIKPLIISPIVFLAILTQLEQIAAKTNVNSLKPVIVQFLLAFQNGFFWKTVISKSKKV